MYRSDIDGLRAVAILLVLFYHLGLPFAQAGFVGVDVFFVISGFLITTHIFQELSVGKFSINNFYIKRMRRILPALFIVLFVSSIVAYFVFLPLDLANFTQAALAAMVSIANLYYWKVISVGYFGTDAKILPLLHTWSLGVEEQFYLFWPLFLILFFKLGKKSVMVFGCCCCFISFLVYYFFKAYPIFTYYSPISRSFELAVGALLALEWDRLKKISFPPLLAHGLSILGFALIIVAGSLVPPHSYPGFMIWLPLLGAVMLIICGAHDGLFNKVLSAPPLVFIGLISYSLYLWHWPIIAFLHYFNVKISLLVGLLVILGSFILSVLSWRFVERPLRFKFKYGFLKTFILFFIVPCAVFSLFVAAVKVWPNIGYNKISTKVYAMAHNYYGPLNGAGCIDASALQPASPRYCSIGNTRLLKNDVLLVGDSHAMADAAMVSVWLKHADLKGYVVTQSGTPFILGPIRNWRNNQPMLRNRKTADLIKKGGYKFVVLGGYWNYYPDSVLKGLSYSASRYDILEKGLVKAVSLIEQSGAIPVILLDNPPLLTVSKYCGYTKLSDENNRCYNMQAEVYRRQRVTRDIIFSLKSQHPNVRLVDLSKVICQSGKCWSSLNGIPLYHSGGENSHLNYHGSTLVGELYLDRHRNPFWQVG